MSTVMRPVGRQRPQVYWRRRLLAVVLVALVVLALVLGVRSLFAGTPGAADATTTPSGSAAAGEPADPQPAEPDPAAADAAPADAAPADAAPADPPADGEVAACTAEQVQVVASADATAYPLGTTAKVGMTITNIGAAACSMDAGSAALELLVVSGDDRIWSSDDCQSGAENRATTVQPGEAGMLASSVDWPLARSASGCAEGLPELRPGTYQLTARAGEITSAPLVFEVQ